MTNPTADQHIQTTAYQVDVPEGCRSTMRVERFTVSPEDAQFDALRALLSSSGGGRSTPAGTYTRLVQDRGHSRAFASVLMSDTPSEIRDHWAPIREARRLGGHCLVNGLGLGVVVGAMLKAGAARVTAVESSKDVIALVAPHYRSRYGSRFEVIHADALSWRPTPRTRFTVVWHDIWGSICADNLGEMTTLHRAYGRRCHWQGSWCKRECQQHRRSSH